MTAPQKRRTPAARRGFEESRSLKTFKQPIAQNARVGSGHQRLPDDWRSRLPTPLDYYFQALDRLSNLNASGWAKGRCPFHSDRHASLSVRLRAGGAWRCFAGCGSGDLIAFHMRRTGLHFRAAVADLIGR